MDFSESASDPCFVDSGNNSHLMSLGDIRGAFIFMDVKKSSWCQLAETTIWLIVRRWGVSVTSLGIHMKLTFDKQLWCSCALTLEACFGSHFGLTCDSHHAHSKLTQIGSWNPIQKTTVLPSLSQLQAPSALALWLGSSSGSSALAIKGFATS